MKKLKIFLLLAPFLLVGCFAKVVPIVKEVAKVAINEKTGGMASVILPVIVEAVEEKEEDSTIFNELSSSSLAANLLLLYLLRRKKKLQSDNA